jgi:hypothetical protein
MAKMLKNSKVWLEKLSVTMKRIQININELKVWIQYFNEKLNKLDKKFSNLDIIQQIKTIEDKNYMIISANAEKSLTKLIILLW